MLVGHVTAAQDNGRITEQQGPLRPRQHADFTPVYRFQTRRQQLHRLPALVMDSKQAPIRRQRNGTRQPEFARPVTFPATRPEKAPGSTIENEDFLAKCIRYVDQSTRTIYSEPTRK